MLLLFGPIVDCRSTLTVSWPGCLPEDVRVSAGSDARVLSVCFMLLRRAKCSSCNAGEIPGAPRVLRESFSIFCFLIALLGFAI